MSSSSSSSSIDLGGWRERKRGSQEKRGNVVWGGTIKEIHVAGTSSPSRRRSVSRLVTFLEAILLRFVVLLALVFVSGLELSGGMCLSTTSQAKGTKAAGAAGRHQKAFWHRFFSFFCHKAFCCCCCCCCNDDCWWVLGGLVVFLCSNPVSFGVLFHDRVCD